MEAQTICAKLDELGIAYDLMQHEPLFTIKELELSGLCNVGEVPKNLFLRDACGKRHYLIVMQKDKQADLSAIRETIGCSRLSFASETRLQKHLGVCKGAVTPLAVLSDTQGAVKVYMDRDLLSCSKLGVHPGVNTSTVWIKVNDLIRYLTHMGHRPNLIIL